MFNINKSIILGIILILMVNILVGCSNTSNAKLPEGIENEKFFNELSSLYGSIIRSFRDNKLNESEIDKSLDKLNEYLNDNKLNEYESLIVVTFNNNIDNIKYDLTHDKGIIKSETTKELEWILEMMSTHFKNK